MPTATEQLHQLFHDEWETRLREDPLFATFVGDNRYNDKLPRATPDDYARRRDQLRAFRKQRQNIDRAALLPTDQLNSDIFARLLDNEIGELDLGGQYFPIAKVGGMHTGFADLPDYVPLNTLTDYENYLARLAAFKPYADDHVTLLRDGVRQGYRPARATLEGVADTLKAHIVSSPEQSTFYRPFVNLTFGESDSSRLREAARRVISASMVPGYQALLDYLTSDYWPASRDDVAASNLPNGAEFYAHRIRTFTSVNDLSAQKIHAIGLAEVQRIRAEMDDIIRKVKFGGAFREFVDFLRTDPRFYVTTPDALLKETALVLKKMDGELPRLFRTLPRLPYGIRPIPDHSAPGNTTAYYFPGSGDGTRAGYYYVNTYDLKSRPLYEIEALSLHEAVPGHHLQIALQQELGGLPAFRRFNGFTAFVEGWALYSERLGLEVGFYQDPYSDFGRLTYEIWRACRLVVDTGMHALGWTRQQAIDYMADHSASTLLNITNEVDRYIAWPGQALAYKIGELKIRELRALAEKELGPRFDLRAFHDVLLLQGAVPLDVLEGMVKDWIASRRA